MKTAAPRRRGGLKGREAAGASDGCCRARRDMLPSMHSTRRSNLHAPSSMHAHCALHNLQTSVDLTNVKMSMNPFCEVRLCLQCCSSLSSTHAAQLQRHTPHPHASPPAHTMDGSTTSNVGPRDTHTQGRLQPSHVVYKCALPWVRLQWRRRCGCEKARASMRWWRCPWAPNRLR